jgi:hypothetical protein
MVQHDEMDDAAFAASNSWNEARELVKAIAAEASEAVLLEARVETLERIVKRMLLAKPPPRGRARGRPCVKPHGGHFDPGLMPIA